MKKTNWLTIGMIVSACLVVFGLLTLVGAIDGGVPINGSIITDSNDGGFASFGTDFYTYVNNNSASAALYAVRTYALLRITSGFMFIGFGALSFCFFATKSFAAKPTIETQTQPSESKSNQGNDTLVP